MYVVSRVAAADTGNGDDVDSYETRDAVSAILFTFTCSTKSAKLGRCVVGIKMPAEFEDHGYVMVQCHRRWLHISSFY